MNNYSTKISIGFNVDKTGLSALESSLENVIFMADQFSQNMTNAANNGARQTVDVVDDISQAFSNFSTSSQSAGKNSEQAFANAKVMAEQLLDIMKKCYNQELGVANINKFSRALDAAKITMQDIRKSFAGIGDVGAAAYNNFASAVLNTNIQIKQGNKLLDDMAVSMGNTIKWGITSGVFNNVTSAIEKAYDYSLDLNESLTNIQVVTNKSSIEMGKFAEEANEAAKALSSTTLDYTNASLIYAQQGLSDEEVAARTKVTLKTANVTDQDTAKVSEQLTAIWNGYKVDAAEAELYIDKVAAVAAGTAADLEEMATGMSKVASAAKAAGVDIDQLNASLATVVSVTREAPESIGTAFKTIYARLGDLELNGEDEFGVSLGKVSSVLKEIGVDIIDQEGNMMRMGQIVEEVAGKWSDLSNAERQATAVALGGKMQYSRLVALFDNWDKYTEALKMSKDALGTLDQQQSYFTESTKGKLQQLEAEIEKLYGNLIDSEGLQSMVSILDNAVEAVNSFVDGFGSGLPTIGAFASLLISAFDKHLIKNIAETKTEAQKYAENLDLIAKKQELLKQKTLPARRKRPENEAEEMARGDAIASKAGLDKEKEYAERILAARTGITDTVHQQLTDLQKQIGELERQAALEEYSVKLKMEKAGLNSAEQKALQESLESGSKLLSQDTQRLEVLRDDVVAIESNKSGLEDILKTSEESLNKDLLKKEVMQDIQDLQRVYIKAKTDEGKELSKEIKQLKLRTKSNGDIVKIAKELLQLHQKSLAINDKELAHAENRIATEKEVLNLKVKISKLKDSQAELNINFDDLIRGAAQIDAITLSFRAFSATAASFTSIIGGLNTGINGYFDIIKDGQIDIEKLLQTLVSLGFTLNMASGHIGKFVTTLKGFHAQQSAITAARGAWNKVLEKGQTLETAQAKIDAIQAMAKQQNIDLSEKEIAMMLVSQKVIDAETYSKIASATVTGVDSGVRTIWTVITEKMAMAQLKLNLMLAPYAGIIMIVVAALALLAAGIFAVVKWQEKQYEAQLENTKASIEAEEAKQEEIKTNLELCKSYEELYNKYKQTGEASDDLLTTAKKLREEYPNQIKEIDILTKNYDALAASIRQVRQEEAFQTANSAKKLIENDIKPQLEDSARKGSGHVNAFGAYDHKIGDGASYEASDKKALSILEKMPYGSPYVSVNKGVDSGHIEINIADFEENPERIVEAYNELVSMRDKLNKELTADEKKNSEIYKNLESWIQDHGDLGEMVKKYEEQMEIAVNNYAMGFASQSGVDTAKTYKDFVKSRAGAATATSKNADISSDMASDAVGRAAMDMGGSAAIYETAYQYGESLYEKFNTTNTPYTNTNLKTLIESKLGSLSQEELQILTTVGINEIESLQILDDYIQEAKLEAKQQQIEYQITASTDAIDSLLEGKKLTKEQLESLESLEDKYKSLSRIQDKNSKEYLEGLMAARDALEEQNTEIEKARSITEIDEALQIKPDAKGFDKAMEEITEQEYEVVAKIKVDAQSDFDDVVTVMDKIGEAADMIGESFKVAAEDVEELNDTFPGILQGMKLCADGTVQLKQDVVKASMEAAQEEMYLSAEKAVKELEAQQKVLRGKQEAAQAIANIAKAMMDGTIKDAEAEGNISAELEKLKQTNQNSTSTNAQTNNNNVAQNAANSATSMAVSYADAYKKMADDSKTWAEAARKNMIYAFTGIGKAIGGDSIQTGWKATYTEGTVTEADIGDLEKGEQLVKNNDWAAVHEHYQRLADMYGNAANNIQGKIAEIWAKNNEVNNKTNNVGKGDGDKDDPDHMDYIEDELDIYHDINIVLAQIETKLDRLQKQEDKLFGKDLIENLNEQLETLNEKIDATKKKLEIARGEASKLKDALAVQGVTFNEDGTIANYEQIYTEKLNAVNAMIEAYNNMSAEEQEKYKDVVELAQKDFEKFVEDIERYDEVITELIPELQDDIQAAIDEQIEIQIEKFDMEIEIRLDLAEAEREWNEFKKKIIDGIKDEDILGNAKASLADFYSYYNEKGTGEVQALTKQINNTLAELKQMDETGWSDVYGDNRTAALEDLEKYYKELMSSMQDLQDLQEEIMESYLDLLDEADEKFQEQLDLYEQMGDILEHDMEVIKLVYGEESYSKLAKYYEQMEKNNNQKLDFLRQEKEYWANQMAQLEEGSDAWLSAKEKWMDAVSEWNDAIEAAIENLQDKYLNAINEIMANLNDKVTNGKGLEYVKEEWELINANAEQYLDTVNEMYEVQQLENKYLDAIDKTDSVSAQKKLNKLMEDELAYLEEKDKLTQYDIDRANKKYEIALKQIALEEAQQNKSTMRLKRDSQGNYRYVYTSDEDEISKLRDELAALENDLYNFDLEAYNANLEALYNAWEEYQQKMAEAAKINDPEERAAYELLINEQYGELINGLVQENSYIRTNLMDSAFTELAELYDQDKTNFTEMTDAEKEALMNDLVPQWNSSYQEMADTIAGEGGFADTCKDAWDQIKEATEDYEDSLDDLQENAGEDFEELADGVDDVADATEDLINDNDALIDTYEQEAAAIQAVIDELQKLINKYKESKTEAEAAAKAAKDYLTIEKEEAADAAAADNNNNVAKPNDTINNDVNTDTNSGNSNNTNTTTTSTDGGNGIMEIGEAVKFTGDYYETSFGTKKRGSKYAGVAKGVVIDKINDNPYGVHIHSADGRYKALGWVKKSQITGYDTGGYTGNWGDSSGRLALLHKKELVLNESDTKNMLSALQVLEGIMSIVDTSMLARLGTLGQLGMRTPTKDADVLEQNVHIEATFPGVQNSKEIEDAFNNLVNIASQRVHRNRR